MNPEQYQASPGHSPDEATMGTHIYSRVACLMCLFGWLKSWVSRSHGFRGEFLQGSEVVEFGEKNKKKNSMFKRVLQGKRFGSCTILVPGSYKGDCKIRPCGVLSFGY
uniref:Uncharacterized protein n=1 Tax=Tanacetum cinerariifolium TaxID=118510 RepID=A0A6L2MV20_TANCI|nr:hypothetical protein [Tanacetum cinerariifolium]